SPPIGAGTVDPAWLDWLPSDRAVGAFALAIDPRRESWATAFAVVDAIEKADLRRAMAGPVPTGRDLIALAAGASLETQLWPRLRGISASIRTVDGGGVDGLLVALHAADPAAAERIASDVLLRLMSAFVGARSKAAAPALPNAGSAPGRLGGRPLDMARRGATVLVAWGEGMLAASLQAHDRGLASAAPAIRAAWVEAPPQRV